jgi:hypothetical protein
LLLQKVETFLIKLTSALQRLRKVFLLLLPQHRYVGSGPRYVLRLAIPNNSLLSDNWLFDLLVH